MNNDWVYFRDIAMLDEEAKRTGPLFRMRLDGSGRETVIEKGVSPMFNISGDWVYYSDYYSDWHLCRIRTDGTEKELLFDAPAALYNFAEEWVYFAKNSGTAITDRIRLDGTGYEVLFDER